MQRLLWNLSVRDITLVYHIHFLYIPGLKNFHIPRFDTWKDQEMYGQGDPAADVENEVLKAEQALRLGQGDRG